QRQPFGGWKRSVVGASAKAGGPNYLLGLGTVRPTGVLESNAAAFDSSTGVSGADAAAFDLPTRVSGANAAAFGPEVERVIAAFGARRADAAAVLRCATESDARAWAAEFGIVRDVTGLTAERN